MIRVEIFTDGACSGNPGAGGWGALLRHRDTEKELSGAEAETTNNRMELTAVIEALKALKKSATLRLYRQPLRYGRHYPMASELEEKQLANQQQKIPGQKH